MRRFIFIFPVLLLFFSLVSAAEINSINIPETHVYYFWQIGCTHCANVEASGILENVSSISGVTLEKLEIRGNGTSRDLFIDFTNKFNIRENERGTPLVVIEQNGNYSYLTGDGPVINNLKNSIINFQGIELKDNNQTKQLTLGAIIIASLIDSINPCAFGVLIFLMVSLLNLGSAKRALKAGLLYTFVVFLVYFLAGFGIFHIIQQFTSITRGIYITAGIIVLFFGAWQFKDVFLPKFGPKLQISPKVKPTIENIARKGTLPAIILLGVFVSLFELPCTGGIYIGILTLMASQKTFAISYLLIYNLIFVLPLIVITFIVYKGTKPETLQNWTSKERSWMKLAAGVVMLALGIYILTSL